MIYGRKTPPKVDAALQDLLDYVTGELEAIERAMQEQDEVRLKKLNAAPAKPRDGMVVFADGTNWNPGSGRGYYGYHGGTWNKLG